MTTDQLFGKIISERLDRCNVKRQKLADAFFFTREQIDRYLSGADRWQPIDVFGKLDIFFGSNSGYWKEVYKRCERSAHEQESQGDKLVLGNQLKTTIQTLDIQPDGPVGPVSALFSHKSLALRLHGEPEQEDEGPIGSTHFKSETTVHIPHGYLMISESLMRSMVSKLAESTDLNPDVAEGIEILRQYEKKHK